MEFNIEFYCHAMKLYNGRSSFFLTMRFGSWRWFVCRWDTVRVTLKPGQYDIRRGPVMTWYCGR